MLLRWRHVIINTHSSWLHGNAKGFRSRDHRIHSSGDYRNPPPAGEHEGLLEYHLEHASPRVEIPGMFRGVVGAALVNHFIAEDRQLLALAVSDLHAHFVIDLPEDLCEVKEIVGRAKEKASRIAGKHLPGFRWAAGGTYKFVNGPDHRCNAVGYILTRQGRGAWTWCPRCGLPLPDRRCPCDHDARP